MMKIRYTIGPDDLSIGEAGFKRGEWREVSEEVAEAAMLPDRKSEYGFEIDTWADAAAKGE